MAESPEMPIDEPDGQSGQMGVIVADLTLSPNEEKTCRYTIDYQLIDLFTSFINEMYKDDRPMEITPNDGSANTPGIIYEYTENQETKFRFICVVSHEAKYEIKEEDFLNPEPGNYSLKRYFQYYWELKLDEKYHGHPIQLVIWTNATYATPEKSEVELTRHEDICPVPNDQSQTPGIGYTIEELPDGFRGELEREFMAEFSEKQQDIDACTSEDPVQDFCSDFVLYTTAKDRFLNGLSVIGIKTTNPEKKLHHGDFFTSTDDSKKLGLPEDIEKAIRRSPQGVLHFISDSTVLAFILVAQVLKKASVIEYSVHDLEYLLSYSEEIIADLKMLDRFCLTVEIPKYTPFGKYQANATEVLNVCTQVCQQSSGYRKIILIYNPENQGVVNSWISDEACRANDKNSTVLKFNFDQLSDESKERIKEAKIKFQGQDVPLQEMLPTESKLASGKVVTQNVLDKIINNEPMVVGNSLPGLTPEVKDCYIKRQFAHCSRISAQSIVETFKGYKMNSNTSSNSKTSEKTEMDLLDGLLSLNRKSGNKKDKGNKKGKDSCSKLTVELIPDKNFNSTEGHVVKTLVISTEPTLFVDIAEKMKKRHPHSWFIEISLNDHKDSFKTQTMNTVDDLVMFLVKAGKSEARLEADKVCEGLKKEGNVQVFLDAFGDFSTGIQNKVVAMVKIMKRTKIQQLWINMSANSKALFCADVPHLKYEIGHHEHSTLIFNQIEDCAGSMFTWENPHEDSIIGNIEASKIVVISGDPGTGKSAALSNIAIRLKEKYAGYWIIQISLNDHTDFLKNINAANVAKQDDAVMIDFLSTAEGLATDSTNLGKVILKNRVMKVGKIIVLLDGLDEVFPLYQQQVVKMVERMIQSKIQQIWIGTRPEYQNVFPTDHCYSLKNFKTNEQERFIKLYLSHLLKLEQRDRCENETDSSNRGVDISSGALYNRIKNTADSTRVMGNALLARMAVEVYFHNIKEAGQSMKTGKNLSPLDIHSHAKSDNVYKLYEQFICQRYSYHCEGKWKAKTSSAMLNMENKNRLFSTAYQRYALGFLFNDKFKLFYASGDELVDLLTWDLKAIGIISERSKKIQFFHRTFAEYYVAQFMVKMLTSEDMDVWRNGKGPKGKRLKAKNKVEFLTFEHLKERNKMIRNFMDHFLSHDSEIHQAVLNDDFDEFVKLVSEGEHMTRVRDKLGRTPLHLACSYKRKKMADYLLELDLSLIADLDNLGFGPVCYAAVRGDEFFMKNMIKAGANYNKGNNEHLRNFLRIYNLN